MARYAILIASSDFPEEPKLQPLRCPERDVDGLGALLSSSEFGDFADVKILKNRPHFEVLAQVSSIFHRAGRDGLVLFYYSGHGRQDREGQLYLATSDTRLVTTYSLAVTSIPIETLKKVITESDTTKVAIILDCCYSGAIEGAFLKGNADSELQRISKASRGTYILTASTALQAAIEKEGDEYGLLTKHIIEGIRNGEADLDKDGLISMDDLYDYVYERVPCEGTQEPMKWALNVKGKSIIIARVGQDMQTRAEIEVLLNEAKKFAQKEFWEQAVKSLRTIQALSPNHHEALSLLRVAEQQIEVASLYNEGVTHYEHSRWDAALDCFQAIHRRVGNYRDLAILVKKVEAGLDRQKIPIFYKEAKIAMSGEEWDVAVEKLQGILSIDSENEDALSLLTRVQNERELSQLYAEGNRHYSAREWSKAWASFNKIREKAADYKATNLLLVDLTEKITAENARRQAQVQAANEEAMEILVTAQASGQIHDWLSAIERLKSLIEANPNHKQVRAKLVYANRRLLEAEQNKTFDAIYAEGQQYYKRGRWQPALLCFLIVWDGLGYHLDVSQRVMELALRNARNFILKWDVTSAIAGVSILLSVVSLTLWWQSVVPQVSKIIFMLTSVVLIGSAYRFYQLTKWSDSWLGERFRANGLSDITAKTFDSSASANGSQNPSDLLSSRLGSLSRIDENRSIDPEFITCAEYQLFVDEMLEKGSYYQPDHWLGTRYRDSKALTPLTGIAAKDAIDFCEWLSKRTDDKVIYRLPTTKEAAKHSAKNLTVAAWCQDKNDYKLRGLTAPIKHLIQHRLHEDRGDVPLPLALERDFLINRGLGGAVDLMPAAMVSALSVRLHIANDLIDSFANAIALETKTASVTLNNIAESIDLELAPTLFGTNAETLSPFALAVSQADIIKVKELSGSSVMRSKPRLFQAAGLALDLMEITKAETPWTRRNAQRNFAMHVLEHAYRGLELMIQELKAKDRRPWWKRLLLPNNDLRNRRRKLVNCRRTISEFYWWLRVVAKRETGALPAWEGIRIVAQHRSR